MAGLLRVAELVEMQHLGIEVLSGRGGLQKHISWAHVSEMYDPTPWLEGGELLLSVGLHFSTSAHEQVAFLERLHGKGVVAFGLPRPRLPLLTQSLLSVSDERSFPILLLPIELSFIEVVRLVAVANQLSAQRHVMTHLRILDALNASVNQGLSPDGLFTSLGDLVGYDLMLCRPDGGRLLSDVPVPPDEIVENIIRSQNLNAYRSDLYIVPVTVRGEPVGYLVARPREGRAAGLVAVQHIATVAALHAAYDQRIRQIEAAHHAADLSLALQGGFDSSTQRLRLEKAGFRPDEPVALYAVDACDPEVSCLGTRVADRLSARDAPCIVIAGSPVLVLGHTDATTRGALTYPGDTRIGISSSFYLSDELKRPYREARVALADLLVTERPAVREASELDRSALLPFDESALREIVSHVLGAVIAYDAEHHSELIPSLRCYLQHDRALSAAARILHLHPNTLGYRLKRIEQLTGRRLAATSAQSELWLALEAQRLLEPYKG